MTRKHMRILIDANHPAHVHLFRNAAREWESRGHRVFWTARNKDIVVDLLRYYGFEFQVLSTYRRGLARMALDLVVRDWKLFRLARQLRPDVMLGTSVNITHVSRMVPARSIFFTESDPQLIRLIAYLSFPFADAIVMPDVLPDMWTIKQVKHTSYHELAYLHPKRFAPDPSVLYELGVAPGEPFFILRFIAWGASHDVGEGGMNLEARRRVIQALAPYGHVFVTAEDGLQSEFAPYRIRIKPHRIHDALYYATLFVGDSQSMTIEASVLGTPALRCNSMVGRTAIIDELEHKYDLSYGFWPHEIDELIVKINELLQMEDIKSKWYEKRARMLEDKVDFTEWMVDFVEHYLENGRGQSA
jgi:predicted glycosyltransferase